MSGDSRREREAAQPKLARVELRVGNRTGAPHADGRRGHLFAEGEVDEEWPRWFAKAIRQRPVPSQFGPFYVYAGPAGGELECVWTNTATSAEEVAASDARAASELAAFTTVTSALQTRRSELERLETRAVVLQEQITAAEGRLSRLQQTEESLERSLEAERRRVTEEKASLTADIKAAREQARQEKQQALDEVVAVRKIALEELSTTKRLMMDDLQRTVGHITNLSDGLLELEAKTAENTLARRSLAHSHLQAKLDQLDQLEEEHRLALGAPAKETPSDRLANAFARSIETGQIVGMVENIANAVRGKKKTADDDDDDDD